MAKYLKRYNKATGKWEIISGGETTVIQQFDSGSPIYDSNISISNEEYGLNANGEQSHLNEALDIISNDIKRLQRNVSWLAEHGGGGGGNGSGSDNSYGIVLISPQLDNNAVYVTEDSLSIKFRITGGTSADSFRYRYTLDGVNTSSYVAVNNDELITITIPSLSGLSNSSTHSVLIEALNPYGLSIPQLSFRIYESSLKLSIDTNRNNVSNGEILLSMNDLTGYIYFKVKNGVERSQTTLHVECNNVASAITYENETSNEITVPFSFWNIIDKNTVVSNGRYTIGFYAQATLGTSVNNKTDMAYFDVRITNPNEMSIYLDGVSYENESTLPEEITSIEQNDKLAFNFKVYLPVNVTNNGIRYALWLLNPDGKTKYELFETSEDNATSATTTLQNYANQSIPIQVPLSNYEISDGWKIYVKAWSYNGSLTAQTVGQFNIITPNANIFPRQYPKRDISSTYSADTCLFAWCSSSRWLASENSLQSEIARYKPCIMDSQYISVKAPLKAYNIDGANSGYITPDDKSPSYLRLQNESYAIADMSEYAEEINYMTNPANSGNGFTMSVTFMSDVHTDADKTVFLWGRNNSDGTLFNGCKISLESVSWFIHSARGENKTITASLRQGKKNTVDFIYNNGNCYISVNGVINAAYASGQLDNSEDYRYPSQAIFACDEINNAYIKFSDINLYECAFYTAPLNGLQIAVNGKNARLNGTISKEDVLKDYTEWKRSNLIYNDELHPEKALSYLVDNNGNYSYDSGATATMRANSPIPSIFIDATNSNFTKEIFHADYSNNKDITGTSFECRMEYYDPTTRKSITFNILLYLQGTSTLGYYIKNLEIKVNERCSSKGEEEKYKLFQVKDTWFPEREYTLKADVVDSAHANNATIGYWINHKCGIMENNPAMDAMTDEYRPKDRALEGENHLHTDSRNGTEEINFDEKVTIKHTLEGFPVLVFIRFDKSNSYDLIGIYSFNLGRFSYFNMGMSFLKEYSRRAPDNPSVDVDCPALVDHYVEYGRNENFNGLKLNEIYSYEFDAGADDNAEEHQTWTQSDKTLLQYYGSFRFNGENPEVSVSETAPIWDSMSNNLFNVTATMGGDWLSQNGFGSKEMYFYNKDTGKIEKKGSDMWYPMTQDNMATFNDVLSIKNAVSYYIIAMGLGMIDSLGKNLTLRTWNGGEKWWTAFYDMDSALQLANEGSDDIPETANVDEFENITSENGPTQLVQHYFKSGSKYNAYNSKLWAILRSDQFLYATNSANTYEKTWVQLRQKEGALSTADNFVSLMEQQIGSCGELVYNYDYNSKYIETGQNLAMLHGLRIENVRKWLKNRLYYLDGVFEIQGSAGGNFDDAPFYKNTFNITNRGHNGGTIGYIPYTFRSTAPTFIRINTGNMAGVTETFGKYFLPAYTDTIIHTVEHTSQKQTNFSSSILLTKIGGLDGIQPVNMNTNNNASNGVLPALTELNISGAQYLDNNPIDFNIFKYDEEGALEHIDVSKAKFANASTENADFIVDCKNLSKIKYIDISNSSVTSLLLPSSILQYLNIQYSNIVTFNMSNQPILKTVNFIGCNRLQTIKIDSCNGLESLSIGGESGLTILKTISIENCNNLTAITIENNPAVESITILNCNNLQNVTITNCPSKNLNISILGCPLKKITMSHLENMANPVVLPTADMISGVTLFDISNDFRFGGIKYGDDFEMETVDGDYVLDLSVFPLLLSSSQVNISNIQSLKYVRTVNEKDNPFIIKETFFNGDDNLIRVYGHISLNSGGIFNKKKYFYLNKPLDKVEGITNLPSTEFVDDKNYTNITVSTEDASFMFSETNCSIGDVYYFLLKCNEKVKSLYRTFENCPNIEIGDGDRLNDTILHSCINVENMDLLFAGTNIKGVIGNNFLNGLIHLKTFKSVFPNTDIFITIDANNKFFPEGNEITELDGFSPMNSDETGDYFADGSLLSALPNIVSISNCFNKPCQINFSRNGELFSNNPSLTAVTDSFWDVSVYDTAEFTIKDLFGSKSLSIIKHSFNFNNKSGWSIKMGFGNSFFKGIEDTITEISSSFTGDGLVKIIDYNDCDGKDFPYEIINNCSKLECLSNFFEGLSGKTDNIINIPSNILNGCTKLKDFRYGFANVKFPYRLVPDGFINNSIENFSYAFSDSNGMRQGMIPYHMFYQKAGNIITDMSYCFSRQASTALTPYMLSGETDEYINANIYDTENNKWNEYFADGSTWFKNKADSFKVENSGLTFPEEYPDTFIPNGQEDYDPSDFDMGIDNSNNIYSRLNTSNYFCPPDIFAYCKNDENTNISDCFHALSRNDEKWLQSGFFGRIPSNIFKPIANIASANGVFYGMHFTPTKWGVKNTENYGLLLPSDLLYPLANVKNMQYIFAETNIWGMTILPSELFANNAQLRDITGLWSKSQWYGNVGVNTQIPIGLFNNNPALIKVSSLFEEANPVLSQSLFRYIYNPKIYDVTRFMRGSNGSGAFIKWWNDWSIVLKDGCYAEILNTNSFSNYDECKNEAPSYFV